MKRLPVRPTLAAFLLVIAAACGGCNHDASDAGAAVAAVERHDPKESFKRIMDTFRHQIEDEPLGFVVSDNGRRSTMTGTIKVDYELVPPPSENDHYKAVVKVNSHTQYSLRRTKTAPDESDNEQTSKIQNKNPLAESDDKKKIALPVPDVKSGKDGSKDDSKSRPSNGDVVSRRPENETRRYELIYENNRWVLVTMINPKTEKSIQFAFDQALAAQ